MTAEEIIASGKLELYVYGALPQDEADAIEVAIEKYPEVKTEVEAIEESLIGLAEAVSPTLPVMVWTYILASIDKIRTLDTATAKTNWAAITGWAAAIACIGGIFWMLNQNNELEETLQITTVENKELENENIFLQQRIDTVQGELADVNTILEIVRSKEYSSYLLPGNQAVAPNAYAKVYYNKKDAIAYIDTNGLPEATPDKVFQVWSLTLSPLTPTSVGLMNRGTEVEKGIYRFTNIPETEAFGITLEPQGGSVSPTMNQLYILGAITGS